MLKGWKLLLGLLFASMVLMLSFEGLSKLGALLFDLPYFMRFSFVLWGLILVWLLADRAIRHRRKAVNKDVGLGRRFLNHYLPLLVLAWLLIPLNQAALLYFKKGDHLILFSVCFLQSVLSAAVIAVHVGVQLGFELLYQWRHSLAESERFQKQHAEARLEALKAQINPHFLFNSLNTLSALIYEDPDQAGRFLRNISKVYRGILEARSKDLIELSEEMERTRDYIQLIETRFQGSVSVVIDLNPATLSARLIPLSVQMLVENAVKHNRASTEEPLRVMISTPTTDQLSVRNDFRPKKTLEPSTKIGLENIRDRYVHLVGKEPIVISNEAYFEVIIPLVRS